MSQLDSEEIRELMKETVHETLLSLGIDTCDPKEMQKDFLYVRSLRESVEAVKKKGWLTIVSILVVGICALLWMGVKQFLASLSLM